MKKIKLFLTIVLCISSISITEAQISENLDKKNGFKEFILGDLQDKWQNDLTYSYTTTSNLKVYLYKGQCCNQVFNYDLDTIRLGFLDNKLNIIFLTTKTKKKTGDGWISDEFMFLRSYFKELFGPSSEILKSPNDPDSKRFCGWSGHNVQLVLEFENMGVKGNNQVAWVESRCNIILGIKDDLKTGF